LRLYHILATTYKQHYRATRLRATLQATRATREPNPHEGPSHTRAQAT